MSKKEKKEKKNKVNEENLYDDLPDGLLEVMADAKLANVYTALYITLFAFLVTAVIALFLMYSQFRLLSEIMNGTSVHIPAGAPIENYTGTINAGTW